MIARDFSIKMSQILGEQLPTEFDNEQGSENIRKVLARIENYILDIRDENLHFQNKLSELLKQIEIYQSEVSVGKEADRRRLEASEL